MMKNVLIFSMMLFASIGVLKGQTPANNCEKGWENGWCWGADIEKAKTQNALYNDEMKAGRNKEALEPLEWLLTNTPNLNKAIYINGIKIYSALLDEQVKQTEKNPSKEAEYQDKILSLHDLRIKYFGEEASVLARKGQYAFNYLSKRPNANKKEIYELYERIFTLNGKEVSSYNLTFMMVAALNLKVENDNANIKLNKIKDAAEKESFKASAEYTNFLAYNEDWVLSKYDAVNEVIDFQIENGKPEAKKDWEATKDKVDALLTKAVTIDCNFVKNKLSDKLTKNPDDLKLAKKALKYMLNAGGTCLDEPIFIVAAQNVFKGEPKGGTANIIADRYIKREKIDSAIVWKEKAIDLSADDPSKQAEQYLDLAKLLNSKSRLSDAREKARKAMELDANLTAKANELIGDMYMNSGNACKDSDPVKTRAIYLAAYDMYNKAGNAEKARRAAAQFPSAEELHLRGYKVGDAVEIGCWIGGSSTIRKR